MSKSEIIHSPAYACMAFMMSDGEKVIVGNNEDYNLSRRQADLCRRDLIGVSCDDRNVEFGILVFSLNF